MSSYTTSELTIYPKFSVPELIPYPADIADVTLRYGEVPEFLQGVMVAHQLMHRGESGSRGYHGLD